MVGQFPAYPFFLDSPMIPNPKFDAIDLDLRSPFLSLWLLIVQSSAQHPSHLSEQHGPKCFTYLSNVPSPRSLSLIPSCHVTSEQAKHYVVWAMCDWAIPTTNHLEGWGRRIWSFIEFMGSLGYRVNLRPAWTTYQYSLKINEIKK